MQKFDHLHLHGVIVHRVVAVFGHDHVDSDEARIGHRQFEAENGLREDLLLGKAAQDLAEIT